MTGPVAWIRFCGDGCVEGPILDSVIEEVQRRSGAWTPLYAVPQPSPAIDLERGLRDLYRAYVRLLESGRDRITSLGGDCDPVDVMERSDIGLRKVRDLLAQIDGQASSIALPTPSAKALHEAVAAVYFSDSSDYISALWKVVRILDPSMARLLERDASAAYEQAESALQPAKGEVLPLIDGQISQHPNDAADAARYRKLKAQPNRWMLEFMQSDRPHGETLDKALDMLPTKSEGE